MKKISPPRADVVGTLPGIHARRGPFNNFLPKKVWLAPHLEVILSDGKTAKIDPDDYEKVKNNGPWSCQKNYNTFYAYGRGNRRDVGMHRLIMGFPEYPKFEVDHINGDGLDNRKKNLRVVTGAVNRKNRHPKMSRSTRDAIKKGDI